MSKLDAGKFTGIDAPKAKKNVSFPKIKKYAPLAGALTALGITVAAEGSASAFPDYGTPVVPNFQTADDHREPVVAPSTNELLLSSKRTGGKGGRDLWKVTLPTDPSDAAATWASPINIDKLNTSDDEFGLILCGPNSDKVYFVRDDIAGSHVKYAGTWPLSANPTIAPVAGMDFNDGTGISTLSCTPDGKLIAISDFNSTKIQPYISSAIPADGVSVVWDPEPNCADPVQDTLSLFFTPTNAIAGVVVPGNGIDFKIFPNIGNDCGPSSGGMSFNDMHGQAHAYVENPGQPNERFWSTNLVGTTGQIQVRKPVTETPPGIILTQTDGSTDVTEGGATDTVSFAVTGIENATQPVAINLTPNSQLKLDTDVLIFQPGETGPKFVTITANDDAEVEGNHTGEITAVVGSLDPNFNELPVNPNPLVANIKDNDDPGTGGSGPGGAGPGGNGGGGEMTTTSSGEGGSGGITIPTGVGGAGGGTPAECGVKILQKAQINLTGKEFKTNAEICTATCDEVGTATIQAKAGETGDTCIFKYTDAHGSIDVILVAEQNGKTYTSQIAGGEMGLPVSEGLNMPDYNNHGSKLSFQNQGWSLGLLGTKGGWVTMKYYFKQMTKNNPILPKLALPAEVLEGQTIATNYHGATLLKRDGKVLPDKVLLDSKIEPTKDGKVGYVILDKDSVRNSNLPRNWWENAELTGGGGARCNVTPGIDPNDIEGGIVAMLVAGGFVALRRRKEEKKVE